MRLRIGLTNFRGVIARVWFNIATANDRLSFASLERQKLFVNSTQGLSPNCLSLNLLFFQPLSKSNPRIPENAKKRPPFC